MAVRELSQVERFFLTAGSAVLVLGLLYWAQAVFIPVTIAALLTFILTPPVAFLQRRGLPRWLSVIVLVGLVFVALAGIMSFFYSQVESLGRELPEYKSQISARVNSFRESTKDSWLTNFLDLTDDVLKNFDGAPPGKEPIPVHVQSSALLPFVQTAVGTMLGFLVHTGLVFIMLVFMLMQREEMRNRVIGLCGHCNIAGSTKAIDDAAQRIGRYLLMQLVLNCAFGFVMACGLALIGVPYAFVWGFLAAILRYVPYLGAPIAALFPILLTFAVMPNFVSLIMVVAFLFVLEVVHANVVEPLAFGHSVGVSGLALLFAAVFWTWLWGPIGLLLSTPLTACLVVLGRHIPYLSAFTLLLGDEPALEKQIVYYQRLLARDAEEATELAEQSLVEQSPYEVIDSLFVGALALARRDEREARLSSEDQRFILETTRDVFRDVVLPQHWQVQAKAPRLPAGRSRMLVVGLPARDEMDACVLDMIAELIDPAQTRLRTLPPARGLNDVLDSIEEENCEQLLLVGIPSGRVTRVRALCQRIHARFPEIKIIVTSLGAEEQAAANRDILLEAGAETVITSVAETLGQLNALACTQPEAAKCAEAASHLHETPEMEMAPTTSAS